MRSLLILVAHPDDETFFAAGTMAKYAKAGVPIGIVCATGGERGATSGVCSIEELPRVREAELREAARLLGVGDVELLPYEDQKLGAAPTVEIRRQIVQAIRRRRPQIVITFDPNGVNQHTDHIAISRFASDGVSAAADKRWYPETGPAHVVERLLWPSPVPVFDLGRTPDLASQPGIDFLIDIAPFRERKAAALRAHRTQFASIHKLFFEKGDPDRTMSVEAFRIGWGPRPPKVPSDDLFA